MCFNALITCLRDWTPVCFIVPVFISESVSLYLFCMFEWIIKPNKITWRPALTINRADTQEQSSRRQLKLVQVFLSRLQVQLLTAVTRYDLDTTLPPTGPRPPTQTDPAGDLSLQNLHLPPPSISKKPAWGSVCHTSQGWTMERQQQVEEKKEEEWHTQKKKENKQGVANTSTKTFCRCWTKDKSLTEVWFVFSISEMHLSVNGCLSLRHKRL